MNKKEQFIFYASPEKWFHSALELHGSIEELYRKKNPTCDTIHGSRRINYNNFARTLIDPSSHSSTIICHHVCRLFLFHSIFAMIIYYLIVPMVHS